MNPLVFDTPAYIQGLTWLGEPRGHPEPSWILRRLPWGDTDARGAWPYQSFPTEALLSDLLHGHPSAAPLTWTGVLRPDFPSEQLETRIQSLRKQLPVHCLALKPHLCHHPDAPPARRGYSPRTRKRLRQAEKIFEVHEASDLPQCLRLMAAWQKKLQTLRSIPLCSSPDAAHFESLSSLASEQAGAVRALELRRRSDGGLSAAMLLVRAGDPTPCWHAHSFLSQEEARRHFGTCLLFDAAIEQFGRDPLWWGGQPAGANGPGVFRFKERFANAKAPAHLLCLELQPERVRRLLASFPRYPWLPPYRNPAEELRPYSVLFDPSP